MHVIAGADTLPCVERQSDSGVPDCTACPWTGISLQLSLLYVVFLAGIPKHSVASVQLPAITCTAGSPVTVPSLTPLARCVPAAELP